MQSKVSIRQILRQELTRLSHQDILKNSQQILKNVKILPLDFKHKRVGLYASIKNEVATDLLFEYLQSQNSKIFFPKMGESQINFYQMHSKQELKVNHLGIAEPEEDPSSLATQLDYCFVPGMGFDIQGHRLGRGRGYYDRYLKNVSCVKMGLAYDFQILESVPADQHDIHMDWVISEQRILDCRIK